jgi:hypothetical protein
MINPYGRGLVKLTGSTSNPRRSGGGTPYYCVQGNNVNFLCSGIDKQIPTLLMDIQIAPEHLVTMREIYTHDIAEKLGHLRPDERTQLEASLKAVDDEEARMARLFAGGKITEAVWDSLWHEWQDRRNKIRSLWNQ